MKRLLLLFLVALTVLSFGQDAIDRGTLPGAGYPLFNSLQNGINGSLSVVSTSGYRIASITGNSGSNPGNVTTPLTANRIEVAPCDFYGPIACFSAHSRDTANTFASAGFWGEMPITNGYTVQAQLVRYDSFQDGGTATSAVQSTTYSSGSTVNQPVGTLTDSTKAWTTDAYRFMIVKIIANTGKGQWQMVRTNSATVLTVCNPWAITPDSTSVYEIDQAENTNFTFGGKLSTWLDSRAPVYTDPIRVHIAKGELYAIRPIFTLFAPGTPSATTAATSAGTSPFGVGNYYISYTYVYPGGVESPGATSVLLTTTSNNQGNITVTAPTAPTGNFSGAIGWKPYIGFLADAATGYKIEANCGVVAFGTNAIISVAPSSTQVGSKWVKDGTPYEPWGGAIFGQWSALTGACYSGLPEWAATNFSGAQNSYNQNPSYISQEVGAWFVLGYTATPQKSICIMGDSRMDGVGDYGFRASAGGPMTRACMAQTSKLYYDPTIIPSYGYMMLSSPGEMASQFTDPRLGNYRKTVANWCPIGSENYSVNDLNNGQSACALLQSTFKLDLWWLGSALTDPGSPQKYKLKWTIEPDTVSTDGFATVTNQSVASGNSGLEGNRRQFNNVLRWTGAAKSISAESMWAKWAGAITPSSNMYAGGDAATTTFLSAYPIDTTQTVSVTVNGSAVTYNAAPSGATQYSWNGTAVIYGKLYASGITFGSAPSTGVVAITYTSMPGYTTMVKSITGSTKIYVVDGCLDCEVNASNVITANGGWWKAGSTATLPSGGAGSITSLAVTSYSGGVLTFSAPGWNSGQWRGYHFVADSGTGAGKTASIQDNNGTQLFVSAPTGSSFDATTVGHIALNYCHDGLHPSGVTGAAEGARGKAVIDSISIN